MFMVKSKALNLTISKKGFEANNEVPTHLRSIRKIMEKKDMQKWGSGCVWCFVKILIAYIGEK